ncbi:hypothetical protein K470DRAFT_270304 [Piedraia hortae CBS 480.64]|uniref:Uncharacterized protein n=1 Tax=Piedraia hortae CBS 480.64 TaxID=1314780 RepID=A0A6A7C2F7_9PEZI|nr:hypothetical protein K470DRAFT_270304 [Piedraia hortae CBS 480.64]
MTQQPNDSSTGGDGRRPASSTRRSRRQRAREAAQNGQTMRTTNLETVEESAAAGALSGPQPFERIGPDATSMDGPVTKARMLRGEIPLRGSDNDPNGPNYLSPKEDSQEGGKGLEEQDGLKLKIEANLEIELELKASIRGDITLSL